MDKIIIKDLKIFAYHGVNPEEKEDGQSFVLDIDLGVDISKPCRTDDVSDTVSYAKVIKTVTRVFTAEKYDLIERAAQVVCDSVFDEYPAVEEIRLLLKKPEAPMKADFSFVAVELNRKREQ